MNVPTLAERWGCGFTYDRFRLVPTSAAMVQWVWASPIQELPAGISVTEVDASLRAEWYALGYEPLEPPQGLRPALLSGSGDGLGCPFYPTLCPGDHVVVAGVLRHRGE